MEDNQKPQEVIDAAVGKRGMNGDIKKFLVGLVTILLAVSGYLISHMLETNDRVTSAQTMEIRQGVAEAKAYTDKMIGPYVAEAQSQDAAIKQIGHDVQRITDFMEFKFGMPHESRRRNN